MRRHLLQDEIDFIVQHRKRRVPATRIAAFLDVATNTVAYHWRKHQEQTQSNNSKGAL